MHNFHFNPTSNRSADLRKQYEQATRQLENTKRQLERKNLEIQFYEDPNYVKNQFNSPPVYSNAFLSEAHNKKYQNLADQIMNNLLQENKSKKTDNKPQAFSYPHEQLKFKEFQTPMYQNLSNFNQNDNLSENYHNEGKPAYQQINPQQAEFVSRQNNFIQQNKRELEKEKLQNASSMENNPFVPRIQPVKRSLEKKEQKPIINERQQMKLKLQQGHNQNSFWNSDHNNRQKQKKVNSNNQPNYQQYQDVREKQKEKLQRQLYNNNFDNYQRTSSPIQFPAEKDTQNISKKTAFENRYSNPFVRDQDYLKQKREEQQRQYRRALEQQKKIEEQRKKMEKKMVKEEKYAFNTYEPGVNNIGSKETNQQNQTSIKSSTQGLTKKVDPNGRPPVYNYDVLNKVISASDIEYMRMKSNQFRENFKKGRILHEEYIIQIKKLAEYYKVDYRELIDQKIIGQSNDQLPSKEKKQDDFKQEQKTYSILPSQKNLLKSEPEQQKQSNLDNEHSIEKFPDSENYPRQNDTSRQGSSQPQNILSDAYTNPLPQQPFYGQFMPNLMANPFPNFYTQSLSLNPMQYGTSSASFIQQMPTGDIDLMRKIFEEVKAMKNNFQKNIEKEKTEKLILQQTFMKFITQNITQNPFQTQSSSFQQFHQSQQPNNRIFSPKPSNKQTNVSADGLQLNINDQSQDFIEKSLSGVVSKIPFYSNNSNQSNFQNNQPSILGQIPQQNFTKKKGHQKNVNLYQNQQTIDQFFSKPYQCKKFQKFSIMVDISQSQMEIPNVSNFLALKNGKDVLNKLFEEDLMMMKKLQKQRDLEKLRTRVDNQLSYSQSSSSQPSVLINEKVSYEKPANFTNYGDTFNKNSGQFSEYVVSSQKKNKRKEVMKTANKYEEYENYSRSKEREIKPGNQQNHQSYRKEQVFPQNAFLKRHSSNNEENLPDFADQSDIKGSSPVYYSPKLNSQILEQDEYQTAQKFINSQSLESQFYGDSADQKILSPVQQSVNKKYQMKKKDFAYEEERQPQMKEKSKSPNFKNGRRQRSLSKQKKEGEIMKMIKENDQVLKKFMRSPMNLNDDSPKKVDIQDYSSINSNPPMNEELKNYFYGSQDQKDQECKLPPLVASSKNFWKGGNEKSIASLSDKFNSQKNESENTYNKEQSLQQIQSEHQNTVFNQSKNFQTQKKNEGNQRQEDSHEETIKSIKLSVENSRRSLGSVNISQTVESIEESSSRMMRPPLNRKKSTGKKKQSSLSRIKVEKDNTFRKTPSSESQIKPMVADDHDIVVGKESLKFDSNIYDSEYEQSLNQKDLQNRISQLQTEKNVKTSEPLISVNPPVIANSKPNFQNDSLKFSGASGKLKSLEEARNLAKQFKKKSINVSQNDQIFKYEEKMSELQSILIKKNDSVAKQTKEAKTIKPLINKSPQKKNIMNLLDELESESNYKEDFESYRQESEFAK